MKNVLRRSPPISIQPSFTTIRFACIACLVSLLPTTALAAGADTEAEANATGASAAAADTAGTKAKAATGLFREGKFEQALVLFDEALALTSNPQEQATLEFNAASCLFELGRYEAARARFLRSATLDPPSADAARLQAAASALKQGNLPEARSLVEGVHTDDSSLNAQKEQLTKEISSAEKQGQRAAFVNELGRAEKVVAGGDSPRGLTSLRQLLRFEPVMTDVERADVHHGMATLLIKLQQYDAAERELEIAEKYAPSDAEIQLTRARLAGERGDDSAAQLSYERSLALGLDRGGRTEAENALESLKPLPRTGWHGALTLGVGYDTNPRQSGTASVVSVGNRARGGSFYTAAMADFGYTGNLGADARYRAYYFGDWLGMTKRSVRDVSLQTHGLALRFDYAPTSRLTLRATAGGSMSWSGQQPIEPFALEAMTALRGTYRTTRTGFARINLELRQMSGFTGWEFLSGTRLDGELSHGWLSDSWSVRGGGRARLNAIGTRTMDVIASDFPSCGAACNGATYVIPLGYVGAGPFVSASVSPGADIWLLGYAAFDYRRYSQTSQITGVPESTKRRVDQRTTLEASIDFPLALDGHLRVIPTYTLLLSRSNVAFDSTDAYYRFDYDDRNFTQQLVELDLELRY